jgi:hypothetical protein
MPTIPDPPTVLACAGCGSPLHWLYSPRKQAWIAFVPLDKETLRVHGCRRLQEPSTWRQLRHGTPPTGEYLQVRDRLKSGSEEQT